MEVRRLILLPCAVAITVALIAGSVVAAYGGRLQSEVPADAVSTYASQAQSAGEQDLATPTAASPGSSSSIAPATGQRVMPVPRQAQPSTRASALPGPGSLLRPEPTPGPRRPTVILDPGHGRGDPGAVHHLAGGEVDLTEAEANLDIAENLRRFLEAKGYDVYITRSGFGKPLSSGPLNQGLISDDLMSRVRLADAVDGDVFISIHNNGSPRAEASGTEIWYCGQHEYGVESGRLAQLILDAAVQGLKDYGYETVRRGTQEDSTVHSSPGFCQFLVTREVQMPAVLTEILFLTNDSDAAVLRDPLAREAVADRIAQAIDSFLKGRGSTG